MTMPDIKISVKNKIAAKKDRTEYICGNSDFNILFTFDAEWDAYETRTARFAYNGSYVDVVFEGNQCAVPVISDTYHFSVGVYAGDLHTTTPAYVPCKKSILCCGGVPADPPEDVYAQIMELLNQKSGGLTDDEALQALDECGIVHPAAADAATLYVAADNTIITL